MNRLLGSAIIVGVALAPADPPVRYADSPLRRWAISEADSLCIGGYWPTKRPPSGCRIWPVM